MTEVHPMTVDDALTLEKMMRCESEAYLRNFLAFATSGELRRQCVAAKYDVFFSLFENGELAGFFCLRGLDMGYARPSFGVYVASSFKGHGHGHFALVCALDWCREQGNAKIMLKVAEDNVVARRMYEAAGFIPLGSCPDTGHLMMERGLE